MEHPAGVRADEVAQALGKSVSTAYYLLTSLCEEGFAVHESKGVYRPAQGLEELTAVAEPRNGGHEGLAGCVDELFLRTRKRSYLGAVRPGRIEIVAFRGRQGVPRMPGLGSEIRDSAHALAMGKVVLSLLDSRALSRYVARGLKIVHAADDHHPRRAGGRAGARSPRRLRGRSRGVRRELLLHRGAGRSTSAGTSWPRWACRPRRTCSTRTSSLCRRR